MGANQSRESRRARASSGQLMEGPVSTLRWGPTFIELVRKAPSRTRLPEDESVAAYSNISRLSLPECILPIPFRSPSFFRLQTDSQASTPVSDLISIHSSNLDSRGSIVPPPPRLRRKFRSEIFPGTTGWTEGTLHSQPLSSESSLSNVTGPLPITYNLILHADWSPSLSARIHHWLGMSSGRRNGRPQPATEVPASVGTEIIYTEGDLPEVWVGAEGADKLEFVALPDPKTSKPRTFVKVLREGRASLGELRTFQTRTPTSFLVHPEEMQLYSNTADASGLPAAKNPAVNKSHLFTTVSTLNMVTYIDPIFLLLPVLCPRLKYDSPDRFLVLDDMMTAWAEMRNSGAQQLVASGMETDVKEALERICDSVDVGDEKAYRFSTEKFGSVILGKALRLVENGLPRSLEDKALILVGYTERMSQEDTHTDLSAASATPGELSEDTNGTQASAASSVFSPSEPQIVDSSANIASQCDGSSAASASQNVDSSASISSQPGSFSAAPASQTLSSRELHYLARVRVALNVMLTSYTPEHVSYGIVERLDKDGELDFTALREHVVRRRELERHIDVSQLYSRKRNADDEDRAAERAEKKRQKEEEDKKKKSASHGVKALSKVNTTGMKKMTSFFQAKPKKE